MNKKDNQIVSEETKKNILKRIDKFIQDCSEMLKISNAHKRTFQYDNVLSKKELSFINDSFDEDQRTIKTQIRCLSVLIDKINKQKNLFAKELKNITHTIKEMNKLSAYRDSKFIELNKQIGLFNSMALLRKKKNIDLFFGDLKDSDCNDLFIEDDNDENNQ